MIKLNKQVESLEAVQQRIEERIDLLEEKMNQLEEHADELPPEEIEPSGDVSYEQMEEEMEEAAQAEEQDE